MVAFNLCTVTELAPRETSPANILVGYGHTPIFGIVFFLNQVIVIECMRDLYFILVIVVIALQPI